MGRFIKNATIPTGSYAIRLPMGTSSLGPVNPADGQVRFNQSNSKVEMYFSGLWNQIAKIGSVEVEKDLFTTANATTAYGPMSYSYNAGQEENVLVFVGGVFQVPGTNYTFNGNTTITLNPTDGTAGQTITVLHKFNSTDAV